MNMKKLLNLSGAQELSEENLKAINGSGFAACSTLTAQLCLAQCGDCFGVYQGAGKPCICR